MILLLPMADAAGVAAQVQKYYANVQHLSGTFTKVVDDPTFNRKDSTKGTAVAEKPNHVRLEFLDKKNKVRTVSVTDGTGFWVVNVMNKEVGVGKVADHGELPAAMSFLTSKDLGKDYNLTLTGSNLELVPKAKSGVAKIVLVVDAKDGHVTESIVTNSQGVVEDTTWSLDDKPDVKSSFTVDPAKDYPGYNVIKL